jgi:hypothetical protein
MIKINTLRHCKVKHELDIFYSDFFLEGEEAVADLNDSTEFVMPAKAGIS